MNLTILERNVKYYIDFWQKLHNSCQNGFNSIGGDTE